MSVARLYFCHRKALLIKLVLLITLSIGGICPGLGQYKNILRLKAISGTYSDETIIRLNSSATYNFDSNWDAYKLLNGGNTPNFYSTLKSINYSINSIPDTLTDITIPFKMVAAFTGNYSIVTSGIDSINFNPSFSVQFEDRLNRVIIDLWKVSSYDFSAVAKDTTSRFYLHIKSKLVNSTPTTPSTTSSPTTADTATSTNNNKSDSTSISYDTTTTTNQNSTTNTDTTNYNNTPNDPSFSNSNPSLTTSVDTQNNDDLIKFYQADHHIELTFNQNVGNTTFYCYNQKGEQILQSATISNCNGNIALDIPSFVKPGYYTLAIQMEKEFYYKKIILH
jgi:hypothetical protein